MRKLEKYVWISQIYYFFILDQKFREILNNSETFFFSFYQIELKGGYLTDYRTRVIIIRGLYTFYLLLKSKNVFSKGFFLKILFLCMVRTQEQFLIKSGL